MPSIFQDFFSWGQVMIYFIQAGENGPIKIGSSDDPEGRLIQLQTANSEELRLLWVWDGNEPTEGEIHSDLEQHNIRGEWFECNDTVLKYIEENCSNIHYLGINKTTFFISESFCGDIFMKAKSGGNPNQGRYISWNLYKEGEKIGATKGVGYNG